MPDEPPVYRFDQADFPLVIEGLHPDTRAVVWSLTIEAPVNADVPIYIPPLARRLGHPITIRMTWANGEVKEMEPPEKPV